MISGIPFDIAWVAIILCGVPIILEAIIGLVTAFDIKADVLVSLALIASICIHEDFAAGEVAFIMQLGALLEDLTVARAQAGIEKLVKLTPQTARVIEGEKETIIMAAIGNATKHGFLVKERDALERLAKVKRVTFDKTDTLTVGVPKVVLVQSVVDTYSDQEIYALAASAEKKSEHPLGKAIIRCFKSDIGEEIAETGDFTMVPGQGVKTDINGKVVCAGNKKLMVSEKIQVPEKVKDIVQKQIEKGTSIIYIAVDGTLSGIVALSDSLRAESAQMIKRLGEIGIVPVLITGDNKEAANQIAGEVGITNVHANCLPEDKLEIIDTYQKNHELVCMIGDGVNDAPALKIAAVGIAMGGVGSDIAVDAADIALVDDEVRELPHLFALSHRMMTKIKFNLSFSMLLNFIAIILAMTGILNPVIGALVHNAGSVFVIVNSAFLMKDKG